MAQKRKPQRSGKTREQDGIPVLNPNTAGLDIGANEIYAAVPIDRDLEPVKCFGTFTAELNALAAWLHQCRIEAVAMEATGVYWIPVFQVLEGSGLQVCLVNPRYFQNVPGRRTDVSDCQWLQRLHSAGLLRGSFRPPQEVCALRSLTRHRDNLIQMASKHILHMQKAPDQMNVQLHHVLSDITGLSGLAIIDAILGGERNPQTLARLRDGRVKASEETILQALTGDYRPEHIVTLTQSVTAYRNCQKLISGCDREIEKRLKEFECRVHQDAKPLGPPKVRRKKLFNNEPAFDLRSHLYRIFGVDLTAVAGISVRTAHAILSEVGPDLSKFRSAAAFASWLGLCPHNDISGGGILSTKTRRVNNRAALAFRMAAYALIRSQSPLGDFFGGCERNWEHRRPSLPAPTNWLALFSICSQPGRRTTKGYFPGMNCSSGRVLKPDYARKPGRSAIQWCYRLTFNSAVEIPHRACSLGVLQNAGSRRPPKRERDTLVVSFHENGTRRQDVLSLPFPHH